MANTSVGMDDPRIADLTHRHPEITYKAADAVRCLLADAEDRGRAYVASQLTEELDAAKAAALREYQESNSDRDWAASRIIRVAGDVVVAVEEYRKMMAEKAER